MQPLTDDEIEEIFAVPKKVVRDLRETPRRRQGQAERDALLEAVDGRQFRLIARQNVHNTDDFSCIVTLEMGSGPTLIIARFNGPSHSHGNPIENTEFSGVCHVHRVTERYMFRDGSKPDHFAEPCDSYKDLDGAISAAGERLNIKGLAFQPRLV